MPASNPTPPPQNNPVPAITSLTPASVAAGANAQTLRVTGTGFIRSTVVSLNGTALTTTYVNSTSMTATVPASAIAADGAAKITAANPSPGGGTSPAQSFSVTVPSASVSSLSPQTVPQGTAATITITGTGFEGNSVVQWNGAPRPTTFVNATTLQVALTAADLQNFGTGALAVVNPGMVPTTPLELLVLSNTPVITGVSPASVAAYTDSSVPQYVFISGSGFASNATVVANGLPMTINSQTPASITGVLPASDFAAPGTISILVTNPGTPSVSSNTFAITVAGAAAPAFTVTPNSVPAGSPDTTITLSGSGFYKDSVVSFDGVPLATRFAYSSQISAVIPASRLIALKAGSISVNTPENTVQPASQPFATYLALPTRALVYNAVDGMIYASVPGYAGQGLGNSVVAIDPLTGVIQKTISVGSEPNRLALSSDGKQLFVGLDGAGAICQVNLTKKTAGAPIPLGGGNGLYNNPYTAVGLAAVPGTPNSVAVYASNGVVTIYDGGVARPNTSTGLQSYFNSNVGGLAFGSSASTLYTMSNAIGGYLYQLTVDSTGVTAATQIGSGTGGSTLQYDNGRLYVPTGIAFDASSGAQVGQFSTQSDNNSQSAATGPIYSDSSLGRVWIAPTGYWYAAVNQLLAFDASTFDPVGSIGIPGGSATADLIRWGQDGLAFHTASQVFILQSPIVKDNSGSPADVAVSIQSSSPATTGSALTFTIQVQNLGPNTAQGVILDAIVPESLVSVSEQATQGSCSGSQELYCDLGNIASGSSATITVTGTPTASGTLELTGIAYSVSYDPLSTNNQASATASVTGSAYTAAPMVTQVAPNLVQAGSGTFTITVNGTGFNIGSTVVWDGNSLPTTQLSNGQLTATVDASLVKQIGWSLVSVTTPAPGGGNSGSLPVTIYGVVNLPASAMAYDPYGQKLYAVLPSSSTSPAGNSIVAIDPATGSVGSAIPVGSEPNLISETSDGNYLYLGLSGAKSLGKFNLLTQTLDALIPLPTNASYQPSTYAAAMAIATVPGSDTSLAVEIDSFDGIGIVDVSGTTARWRAKYGSGYSGDYPVFADATHFYAHDSYTSGNELYRYTVDADGVQLVDGSSMLGLGGFGGKLAYDRGMVYGSGGGLVNPSTTPPTQIGVFPIASPDTAFSSLTGAGAVPYGAEGKSFNMALNSAGYGFTVLQRFDTAHLTLEDWLSMPNTTSTPVNGLRWGQDGLAYIMTNQGNGNAKPQILLLRGPFVLPAEAYSNAAPTLTSTDHTTITPGGGNLLVTVTGTGFLSGATVLWNDAPRTTTFVDAAHLRVAVPASDVKSAATIALTSHNPGSSGSNTINITVQ